MDAIYYVCSLVGVGWLVVWIIRLERNGQRTPSPFDMRDAANVPKVSRFAEQKRG